MQPRLEGKVAIVTGAGSGMGRATCITFAREGAKVVAADINEKACKETVAEIKKSGGEALAVKVDVSSESDIKNMVATAVNTYGRLDVLFNNAGIAGEPGLEISEKGWNDIINIDLKSVYLGCRYGVAEMRKHRSGSIISTSSVGGIRPSGTRPVYSAAKGGVVLMTMALSSTFAADGVRINCICPGSIDTGLTPEFMLLPKNASPEFVAKKKASRLASVPLGRTGKPEDIANAALFLASDESSFITGVALVVDGGATATVSYRGPTA